MAASSALQCDYLGPKFGRAISIGPIVQGNDPGSPATKRYVDDRTSGAAGDFSVARVLTAEAVQSDGPSQYASLLAPCNAGLSAAFTLSTLGAVCATAGTVAVSSGHASLLQMSSVSWYLSDDSFPEGLDRYAMRVKYTPSSSGAPAGDVLLFGQIPIDEYQYPAPATLTHRTTGALHLQCIGMLRGDPYVMAEGDAVAQWHPVAGTEYEIEMDVDSSAGTYSVYVDGARAATIVGSGLRDAAGNWWFLKCSTARDTTAKFRDVALYTRPLHTTEASYATGYSATTGVTLRAPLGSTPCTALRSYEELMVILPLDVSGTKFLTGYVVALNDIVHLAWMETGWSGSYATVSTTVAIPDRFRPSGMFVGGLAKCQTDGAEVVCHVLITPQGYVQLSIPGSSFANNSQLWAASMSWCRKRLLDGPQQP